MAIVDKSTKERIAEKLEEELENDIKLVMFTQDVECQFCSETRQMVEEMAQMTSKITTEIHDFVKEDKLAKKFGIMNIPAVAILGNKDYGVRFVGVPSGYEFTSFIEGMINVSRGRTDLSEDIRKNLAGVKKKVSIQVLVTPTCPYCAVAVQTAHKLAIENENIFATMVEIIEFPEIAMRYSAMSVPKIIINDVVDFVGAHPPDFFVEQINKALRSDNPMYL